MIQHSELSRYNQITNPNVLRDYAKSLSAEFYKRPEYQNYLRVKSLLNDETVLKINEFKQAQVQFALSNSISIDNAETDGENGRRLDFEHEANLNRLYRELCCFEYAKEFLHKEKVILDMLREVYDLIAEQLDIDLGI